MSSSFDGEVLINTKIETEEAKRKLKDLQSNLEDVADDTAKTGTEITDGLSDAFTGAAKVIGPAVASAFAVDKLIDFGQEAINLGSDLQEVQNVVDVTFGAMSEDVNEFARNAAMVAGLSETMAKQFVGTFGAMADSFGFAEEENYKMSTSLAKLSGDVASFYNMTQEEAFNKLKSVFTGETESLKEIGVVMTQAALDAYALEEGFGKVTSEMSEQEKVALRYAFVTDQLSSASGDFARTQDSWANQTRILSLQWESFMGTMGKGFIEILTPGIQTINEDLMPALQQLADDFAAAFNSTPSRELAGSIDDLKDSFEDAEAQFEEANSDIEVNAAMAKAAADELKKLETAGLNTTESQKKYEAVVKRLNELIPDLNLTIDEQTGLIKQNTEELYANIEALKERAIWQAGQEKYTEMETAYKDAVRDVYDAEYALVELENERVGLIQDLANKMGISYEQAELLASTYGELNGELTASDILYKSIYGTIASLNPLTEWTLEQIFKNSAEQAALNDQIERGNIALDEAYTELTDYSQQLEESVGAAEAAAGGQDTITEAAGRTVQTIQELREEYDAAREAARKSIDQQISMFDQLDTESEKTAADIVADAKKTVIAYSDYGQNLKKLVDRGMPSELAAQFGDFSERSIQYVQALVDANDQQLGELISTWEKFGEVKDVLAAILGDLETATTETLDDIEQEFRDTYGELPDYAKESVDDINRYMDDLQKTVYIDIITRYSEQGAVTNYGGGGYYGGTYTPPDIQLPYLAEGAVIPPNAPFTAVLGDQRSGYNLEGPEDMFRGIVREENAETVRIMENVGGILGEILRTMQSFDIDGQAIFDIYNGKAEQWKQIWGE